MRLHVFVLLAVSLFSWSFARALPQKDLDSTLQDKVDTTLEQQSEAAPVFGSVEALWQYTSNPPYHRGSSRRKTAYIRTHATAVISGNLVFIHLTYGFQPGSSFVKQPKLLELTFTALDGSKVILQPSYQPLKRRWVFARIKTAAN